MKIKKRWLVSFIIICVVAIASLFWENKNQLQHRFLTTTAINFADVAWLLTSSSFVLLMTPGLSFFYGGMVGTSPAHCPDPESTRVACAPG